MLGDMMLKRFFNFSSAFISKFNRSHVISLSKKIPLFQYKNPVLQAAFLSSSTRRYYVTDSSNTNILSSNGGKLYRETENEYAHQVMERLSSYSNSLIKWPFQYKSCVVEESLGHSNIVDRFAQITLHNISEGTSLEHVKYTDIVEKLCVALPDVTDENVKRILHYLCMWPQASSTKARNFKNLWNLLDQECVKRMKLWNDIFHRKFSKMSKKNNHLVFVYGTLKRGEPNYDLIEKRTEGVATFLGNAKTVKKWPLIIASRYNIPYLLYAEGRGMNVIGEVYEVDDIMFSKLDELECHPEYYTRLIEEVHLISDKEEKLLKPWIYFLKNFRSELLELPYLSEYSSKGSHGLEYVSSEDTCNPEDVYT